MVIYTIFLWRVLPRQLQAILQGAYFATSTFRKFKEFVDTYMSEILKQLIFFETLMFAI